MRKKIGMISVMTIASIMLVLGTASYKNNTINNSGQSVAVSDDILVDDAGLTTADVTGREVDLKTIPEVETSTEETPLDTLTEESSTEEQAAYDGTAQAKNVYENIAIANVDDYLKIREEASTDGEVVGKLYDNSIAEILEYGEQWCKISSGSVEGYVATEFLLVNDEAKSFLDENCKYVATVNVEYLNVRNAQSSDSEKVASVLKGQEFTILNEYDQWVEIQVNNELTGFVSSEFVDLGWNGDKAVSIAEELAKLEAAKQQLALSSASISSGNTVAGNSSYLGEQTIPAVNTSAEGTALGQEIAAYAIQFVGNPYVWGGTSLTNGADCCGFTQSIYAQFGYGISRTVEGQVYDGVSVSLDEIQPGDLLFYSGHVALYIGGGQIVHASTPESGIKISNAFYTTPYAAVRIVQ